MNSKIKLWVVRTPTGDRSYVSIHKPQSYIDHLDASGELAEVFELEVMLPSSLGWIVGSSASTEVSRVGRVR